MGFLSEHLARPLCKPIKSDLCGTGVISAARGGEREAELWGSLLLEPRASGLNSSPGPREGKPLGKRGALARPFRGRAPRRTGALTPHPAHCCGDG